MEDQDLISVRGATGPRRDDARGGDVVGMRGRIVHFKPELVVSAEERCHRANLTRLRPPSLP